MRRGVRSSGHAQRRKKLPRIVEDALAVDPCNPHSLAAFLGRYHPRWNLPRGWGFVQLAEHLTNTSRRPTSPLDVIARYEELCGPLGFRLEQARLRTLVKMLAGKDQRTRTCAVDDLQRRLDALGGGFQIELESRAPQGWKKSGRLPRLRARNSPDCPSHVWREIYQALAASQLVNLPLDVRESIPKMSQNRERRKAALGLPKRPSQAAHLADGRALISESHRQRVLETASLHSRGLNPKQIARRQGVTLSTVYRRLRAAGVRQ